MCQKKKKKYELFIILFTKNLYINIYVPFIIAIYNNPYFYK